MTEFRPHQFTTPDGLTLAADIAGPDGAPTVILLHGGGQTRHSWAGAMRRLVTGGYRVINYDARGHGDSDWSPDADYSITALASDLHAVIATVDGPVALVGASMGGMTSFYAIGNSDTPIATALIMVDIVLRPAKAGEDRIFKFMNAHRDGFATLDEAAAAVAAYNPDRPRPSDPAGLMKNLRLRDGRLYWHWDPRMLDARPSAEPPGFIAGMLDVARHVTLPTLLIRGGHSDIVDDKGVAEMCALVPQTDVFNVADAGHMVAGDRNDAFNDGVIGFLGRHLPLTGI